MSDTIEKNKRIVKNPKFINATSEKDLDLPGNNSNKLTIYARGVMLHKSRILVHPSKIRFEFRSVL
jgi:hypothetical protein